MKRRFISIPVEESKKYPHVLRFSFIDDVWTRPELVTYLCWYWKNNTNYYQIGAQKYCNKVGNYKYSLSKFVAVEPTEYYKVSCKLGAIL